MEINTKIWFYNQVAFQILIGFFSEEAINQFLSDPMLLDVEEFRARFEKMRPNFSQVQSAKRRDWKRLLEDPT